MSDANEAIDEMQGWLADLSADDPADYDANRIEREVAFLVAAVDLQEGARLLLTAPQPVDAAYLLALEDTARARGATMSFGDDEQVSDGLEALVSFDATLGLGDEADDSALLQRAASSLQPGGRYLIDLLNREWVVQNPVQNLVQTSTDGTLYLERSELDFIASRQRVFVTAIDANGSRRDLESSSRRLYTLTELIALLETAGFTFEAAFGGFEGEAYGPEMPRMVVLARKLPSP